MVVAIGSFAPSIHAQAPKPPGLGYVYPPVVRAGESTEVQFGGFDFTRDMQWFVHDKQVQLETDGLPGDYHLPPPPYWIGPRTSTTALPIPREVAGKLTVDAAASEGLVRWQVANANGASETAVVFISYGSEISESRSRDFPQRLPALPIGVSGRLARLTEVDRYQIVAERDGIVSVDLMARRLGADFNGVLQIHDSEGKMLTDFADTLGLDGGLAFPAVAGKTYTISVHDADFRGDRAYVYRLGITQEPQKIGMTLSNVPEQASSALETNPTGTPQLITTPGAVTGRMLPGESVHRYEWASDRDETWSIALQSRSLDSRMDVAIEILDPAGNRVADNDDLPGTTDAGLEFQAKTAGNHTAVIRNLSSSTRAPDDGTAMDVYRLELQRAHPDFSLSVPQRVTLALGGKTEIPIKVTRSGGFAESIQLSVNGLPEGVSLEGDGVVPAAATELKLTLQSTADAAVTAQVIHVSGAAKMGESEIVHPASATAGGNLSPRSTAESSIPEILLAMTMPAPFEIQVVDRERQHDVHRGTTFLAELDIVRHEGFTGEIQLEMTAQQSRYRCGIRGGILTVTPGQTKVFYPCFMPEWLGTELTRRIVVHGVAAIPDPKGNLRYVTKTGDARITMILEGALLKLNSEPSELTVVPGATFEIPLSVARSAKLPQSVSIELSVPDEIKGLLRSEPLTLSADQDQGVLKVTTEDSAALNGPWTFTVKATALQDDVWPVISETDVPVVFSTTHY